MKTYWDLNDADRAALSYEEVNAYVDAELMLKGVLKVRPLTLEPLPDMPEPDGKPFIVRIAGKYGRTDASVAFSTIDAAKAFLALEPLALATEYLGSEIVAYTSPMVDPEIAEVPTFTREGMDQASAAIKKSAAIKSANDRRTREYESAVTAQNEALKGLWEDWAEQREHHSRLRGVADTYADYVRTAGDNIIAASFLAKVYPADVIAEACERFGLEVTR